MRRSDFFSPFFPGFVAILMVFTACQKNPSHHHDDDDLPQIFSVIGVDDSLPGIDARHLMLTTLNLTDANAQAKVAHIDLDSHQVDTVLTGESRDPALFGLGQDILLFNRSAGNVNMRRLYAEGDRVKAGDQRSFLNEPLLGDPHDVVSVGGGKLLLALYNAGKLAVMDAATGAKVEEVTADWDLPAGVALKPEALAVFLRDGERFVYVVHQALSYDEKGLHANGSQQIFVLKADADGHLQVMDQDASRPKIQGITLQGSYPVKVPSPGASKLLLVSLCSAFAVNDAEFPCHAAVEELDPATNRVAVRWDLTGVPVFYNGTTIAGENADVFYASVETHRQDGVTERSFMRFDMAAKARQVVAPYAAGSYGMWAAYYDSVRGLLWVGDSRGEAGVFTLFKDGLSQGEIALPGPPYGAATLSRF